MTLPRKEGGKKRLILVIIDRFTGFSEARAFKGVGSREIVTGLDHWVKTRGWPRVLCADVD